MKRFSLLFILLSSYLTHAQNAKAPDYDLIEKTVSDPTSEFYYKTLRERFDRRDTTFSFQDFKHVYYGFFFQPDFRLSAPTHEELDLLRAKEDLTDQDCHRILELTPKVLKEYPFDLRRMSLLIHAYRQLKDIASAKREVRFYSSIIDVIFSTGDGLTCETGYHVASISHEYTIMSVSRLGVASQSLIDHCDYLKAAENEKRIAGFYFDITKVLEKESLAFGGGDKKAKKKRKKKGT